MRDPLASFSGVAESMAGLGGVPPFELVGSIKFRGLGV